MNLGDLSRIVERVKAGPVPQRLLFVFCGKPSQLEPLLEGIDVHRGDLITGIDGNNPEGIMNAMGKNLRKLSRTYRDNRQEPSALILENAILIPRYGCDLSAVFQYALSPRSLAVLLLPSESKRELPPSAEKWVVRNTRSIHERLAQQTGVPDCLITS